MTVEIRILAVLLCCLLFVIGWRRMQRGKAKAKAESWRRM